MLSIRKPGAPNLNLWPGSTVQKPEVLTKVPKVVRNVVKLTVIWKNACKTSSRSNLKWICKTGSSSVLWPTFGQIEIRGCWVRKTGRRHISSSGLASRALWTLFFALFWPALSPYRTSTARNAFYKKTGCTKSKSVVRKYSWETGSTFQSARNCPKCREIDRISKNACKKSSWSNLKWTCKTGSSFVLWPTFREIDSLGRWVRKTGRRHIFTSGLASRAPRRLFLPYSGLYCRRIAHRRTQMLSVRKPGAPSLKLWPGSTIQKPEVLTKVPEMSWNWP